MSEDGGFGGAAGTPRRGKVAGQDFGFFTSASAGSSTAAAPSQFGGPPAPAAAPAPAPALTPLPVPTQFGPPPTAPLAPFGPVGAPPGYGPAPYPPAKRSGLPAWAIVLICVPVALVVVCILAAIAIPVFLNQRSTPVMPDSIHGVPRSIDPTLTRTALQVRDEERRKNPGSKIDAAGYGTALSGYVVVGANLRIDAAGEFSTLGSTDGPMSFGATQCGTNNVSHVSLCVRVGTRGSIELVAFGGSDLSELAAETGTVWAAQPFGT